MRAHKRRRLDDGTWEESISDENLSTTRGGSTRVSQAQYFTFVLQIRQQFPTLHFCGRLFQEFIVDAYAAVEQSRLNFMRTQQSNLRADLYRGLQDALQTDPLPITPQTNS